MASELIRTSILLLSLQKIKSQSPVLMNALYNIFVGSQTYKLIVKLREGAKVNFRYSFLGRITEINQEPKINIINSSRVMSWFKKLFNNQGYALINLYKSSLVNNSTQKFTKAFYLFPVKTASKIMITALVINIILSFLIKNRIGISGWLLRGIFLFIAYNGLYSDAGLEELSKTSYFIKRLNNS